MKTQEPLQIIELSTLTTEVVKCCGNCHFSARPYETNPAYLTCRRYPPTKADTGHATFPWVQDNYWCGEFQNLETAPS